MNTKDLAKQRIKKLMQKAKNEYKKNPERSQRYAEIAWKIKQKTNISLPKKYRQKICRKCQNYLVSGETATIRTKNKKKTIKCKKCNYTKRIKIK